MQNDKRNYSYVKLLTLPEYKCCLFLSNHTFYDMSNSEIMTISTNSYSRHGCNTAVWNCSGWLLQYITSTAEQPDWTCIDSFNQTERGQETIIMHQELPTEGLELSEFK